MPDMNFTFTVIETMTMERLYTVEADNEAEAREMALIGNTVDESSVSLIKVLDRTIVED